MPKRKKKFKIAILILAAVFMTGFKAQNDVKIYVNNKIVKSDQPPLIFENRTFVPVRVIAEDIGAKVEYHREDLTVTIEKDHTSILIAIGDDKAGFSDGIKAGPVPIDAPAFIKNNRTYLPLRAISELFDMNVNWDAKKRAVYIDEKPVPVGLLKVDDAGNELIKKLREKKVFDKDAYVAEASDYEVEYRGSKEIGFWVTLRKDNPFDEELAELVGHYFINKNGTLVLKYDVVKDTFERIY